jgi:uncharacterized protein
MNYKLNFYRSKKFGDKYLVTTDHGSWLFLTEKDYLSLENEKIDEDLFKKLEEAGIVITKNNQNSVLEKNRMKYAFLNNGVSLHIVIPTLRCNIKCIYCHASSRCENEKGYDMDKKTAEKTVDFIFQTPAKSITIEFQGGEPLLNFEIVKHIVEYAYKVNEQLKKEVEFTIVTNLLLMNDEKLNFLLNHNIGICTSLDGPKEVHDKNRAGHDVVVKWIKKINEEYKKRKSGNYVGALVTTSRHSLAKYKEIIEEYVGLGFHSISMRDINYLGFAKNTFEKAGYTAEEYTEYWKKSVDYILEKNYTIRERMLSILLSKIFLGIDPGFLDIRSPCGAGIGQLTYLYNGDIYTCDEGRAVQDNIFRLGNVKKNRYRDITTGRNVCAVCNASLLENYSCDDCAYKPYCGTCPVLNYSLSGNVIGSIPESWKCKVLKAQFDYIFDKILNDNESRKKFLSWFKTNPKAI